MFQNVGSKLKTMAKVFCFIGIAVSVIYGIMMMVTMRQTLAGILIIVLGALGSWLSCLSLYGLGIVVEDHETPALDNSQSLFKQIQTLQNELSALSAKADLILSSKQNISKRTSSHNTSTSDNNGSYPEQESTGIQNDEQQWALLQEKLRPILEYALKFSTDDGLAEYLNREYRSLSPEEQAVLSDLIDLPVNQIRAAVSVKLKEL